MSAVCLSCSLATFFYAFQMRRASVTPRYVFEVLPDKTRPPSTYVRHRRLLYTPGDENWRNIDHV